MEPGLLCDCAVNTAVLSPREPAQYGETLSSLLLLIEKPIAIYLLTLDIKSIPGVELLQLPGSPLPAQALSCPGGGLLAGGGSRLG